MNTNETDYDGVAERCRMNALAIIKMLETATKRDAPETMLALTVALVAFSKSAGSNIGHLLQSVVLAHNALSGEDEQVLMVPVNHERTPDFASDNVVPFDKSKLN